MHFEEVKVFTNDKHLVIDVVEKRLIEKNVSYVKLNYDGYTEFHFLDYIYKITFVKQIVAYGKYEVMNNIINSLNKGLIDKTTLPPTEEEFFINAQPSEALEEEKTGYKKYTKKLDRFNKGKINSKGYTSKGYFRR